MTYYTDIFELLNSGDAELTNNPNNLRVYNRYSQCFDDGYWNGPIYTDGIDIHDSKHKKLPVATVIATRETVYSHINFKNIEAYIRYLEILSDPRCNDCFMTEDQYQESLKRDEEEREYQIRINMEALCQEIMAKYRINHIDCVEFYEKLDELADEEESEAEFRINGLYEDGLCIGSGVTAEEWCDELNNAKFAAYNSMTKWLKLRDYLNEKFPIFSVQMRQNKLQEA